MNESSKGMKEDRLTEEDVSIKRESKRIIPLIFLLLCLLGITLRLYRLGQSLLYIDEITITWFAALPRTVGNIFHDIYAANMQGFTGQNMPIQYALLNVFYHIYKAFGIQEVSEFLTRLPYALTGILSLPLMYLTVKRVFNSRRIGLWALLLLSTSFSHVLRSRDATGYAPLMFFILLNSYGLAGLMLPDEHQSRKKTVGFLVAFIFGVLGSFLTHLTSWFYLAPEGVVAAVVSFSRMRASFRQGNRGKVFLRQHAVAFIMLGSLLVMALCFIRFPLAVFKGHGIVDNNREYPGLTHVLYQVANFSWGQGAGRLAGAFAILTCALITGWKQNRSKVYTLVFLVTLPVLLIATFNFRDVHPRYLSVVFPAYVALLAVGFSGAQDFIARHIRYRQTQVVFIVVVVLLLGAWLSGPYRALYSMHRKLFPMYELRQGLEQVLEPNAPYIWQNGYHARQLGQAYKIPGHHSIPGIYPSGQPNPGQPFIAMNDQMRRLAMALPQAVLIVDEKDAFFQHEIYLWPNRFYQHRLPIQNEPWVDQLYNWGFESIEYKPGAVSFAVLYNTTEEVIERLRNESDKAIWPKGDAWQYQQIQNGMTLMSINGEATLQTANFVPEGNTYTVRFTGLTTGSGSILLAGAGLPPNGIYGSFSPSQQAVTVDVGPVELKPGLDELNVTVLPSTGQPLFYVVAVELVPVEP